VEDSIAEVGEKADAGFGFAVASTFAQAPRQSWLAHLFVVT